MRRHVDPATVAEFREGLLPRRRAARVGGHLSACPRCADVDAGLAEVTALLAATPPPPMPVALAARLDAALAREGARAGAGEESARPVPGRRGRDGAAPGGRHAGRRRPRSSLALRAAVTVAAVAVLGGGGGYALSLLVPAGPAPAASSSDSSASARSGVSAPAPATSRTPRGAAGSGAVHREGGGALRQANTPSVSYPVVSTGTDYQAGHLTAQVTALLRGRSGPSRQTVSPFASSHPAASATMPDLPGCVARVTGGRTPEVVDVSRYGGRPAAVIVVPAHGGSTVWVVGTGCSGSSGDVITRISLPQGG